MSLRYYAPNDEEIQTPVVEHERVSFTTHLGFYSTHLGLQIKNITKENSGLYACQAKIRDGTTEDRVINVTVLGT